MVHIIVSSLLNKYQTTRIFFKKALCVEGLLSADFFRMPHGIGLIHPYTPAPKIFSVNGLDHFLR
jgi:hypothetical protein